MYNLRKSSTFITNISDSIIAMSVFTSLNLYLNILVNTMRPGAGESKVKVGSEVDRKDETPVISFITGKKTQTTVDMTPIVPVQQVIQLLALAYHSCSRWQSLLQT